MPDSTPHDRLTYLDFDLEIGPGQGREYPVAVLRSPAGEARETLRFPFDELQLESRLKDVQIALLRSGGKRRQILSPEEQAVQAFGGALFNALFTGDVRSRYDVSQERAAQSDRGLRVKLRITAPELAALPWEFLYDSRQADYVCMSRNTPLVRYLECPQPVQPLAVTPPLRVLGLIASPSDQESLDASRERRRVEDALKALVQRGLVELVWWDEGQTWRDVQRALRGGPWHVFHFVGHGGFDRSRDEGLVVLPDDDGRSRFLPASDLARLLAVHRTLRLVVLNACEGAAGGQDVFSSTASILVRRGIPAVLAMQYAITDRAAVEFARGFYEALADGLPVDAAVSDARQAVSLAVTNTVEWGTPVLHMRAPDGLLFNLAAALVQPKPTPSATAPTPAQPKPVLAEPARSAPPAVLTVDKPIRMELVRIPAGEFLMGSDPARDKDARDDEKPQHRVYLPDFYLARTPVTNAQFEAFVKSTRRRTTAEEAGFGWAWTGTKWEQVKGADWRHPGGPKTGIAQKADHPVVQVSWEDAAAFCQWLSEAAGGPFRLPSEAEWEKAARGAAARLYPWGDEPPTDKLCNFNMNVRDTTPVGAYPGGATPVTGILDLAGNVWEWCSDWYDANYYTNSPERSPAGLASGQYRVLRGGSWDLDQWSVRAAVRNWDNPDFRNGYLGFRCARSP